MLPSHGNDFPKVGGAKPRRPCQATPDLGCRRAQSKGIYKKFLIQADQMTLPLQELQERPEIRRTLELVRKLGYRRRSQPATR